MNCSIPKNKCDLFISLLLRTVHMFDLWMCIFTFVKILITLFCICATKQMFILISIKMHLISFYSNVGLCTVNLSLL